MFEPITKVRSECDGCSHCCCSRDRWSRPPGAPTPATGLQSEHIFPAAKTSGFPDNPARRAECSAPENFATCCPMRHLKTLACPAEDHRMLADHIAFADRPNRYLIIGVPHLAQNSGKGLRCSAGRVFLRLMMRLNNFNIEFRAKRLGSVTCQGEKRVHACAEVRRENNRNGPGGSVNSGALFRGMSRCSDNERSLILQGSAANLISCIRMTKIDHDI